jgi:hypothetical protein
VILRYRAASRFTVRRVWRASLAGFLPLVGALACARGSIPIVPAGAVLPSTLTAAAAVTRTPLYFFTPGPGFQFPHAVFGIPEGETVTVRQVAGVSGGDVGELRFDQRGLTLTGNATSLGSSSWVEVERPTGGTGWVRAVDLTQDIPRDAFCGDARVRTLLEALQTSIADRDAAALQSIVSPRRGLTVRFDWWNPEVTFTTREIADLLGSDTPIDWGTQQAGGQIRGSFKQVVLPRLDAVATGEVRYGCDETLIGPALREARWPSEYVNLNYYALFHPAEPTGSEFAWTTWLVGIEYVDNQPYVSHLVQLRAGI